ncbi:DUF1775 domain-containing protein [Nocardioides plantarum]|uniref:DUF1775 domain-containing protein n=1 Tax=Nocardioides plantarum TaxID=29299 RepID=A0ABV5KBQ2_9ACTN|nr:DUF1775 domain-containing protein [Nocardioides plantarum]
MSSARRTPTRPLTRIAAATGAAGALTLLAAGAASAHVSVTPSDTAAGSYTLLTFSVPHGCDGSPTTKVAIQLPDGINEAAATRNPFYKLSTTTEKLAEPLVAEDGDEVTERTSTVTYTAVTPLPDGERDSFELSLQLPEDAEGKTLAFPVIQTCEKGETAWTEVAKDGQSEDDLEHPAPAVAVTAAGEGDGHGAAAATEDDKGADTAQVSAATDTEAASDDDGDGNGLAIAGLATGLAGIVVAAVALARTRRTA